MKNIQLRVTCLAVVILAAGCQGESVSIVEPIEARHESRASTDDAGNPLQTDPAQSNDVATGQAEAKVDSVADPEKLQAAPWANFKKPSLAEIQQELSQTQFEVTQKNGTEPAFKNEYWDNKQAGIYVDIVSGEPLFSSADKFHSGTGWPSFVQPLDANFIVLKEDNTLLASRTEVRSKLANSHLGHVFNDGPPKRGGRRWCMNSAAMRFVPKDKMDAEGYGSYLADAEPPTQ